jgi:hypothetical protein
MLDGLSNAKPIIGRYGLMMGFAALNPSYDQSAANALTSTKNCSCTRRSIIKSVLGG